MFAHTFNTSSNWPLFPKEIELVLRVGILPSLGLGLKLALADELRPGLLS
jgi:hypothetical protein